MARIVDNRNNIDQTVRIFDSFYMTDLVVNATEFDIVYGYFSNVCKTDRIAANFTTVLFRISQETGVSVLELISILKGAPNKIKMNELICYYLNSFKSKTSLYGIGVVPKPNQPVARNVVL